MRVLVGSTNPTKVSAVREALERYPLFAGASVVGVSVESGVAEQPLSLEEMFRGAAQRAESALALGADVAVGLESGLFPVSSPFVRVGMLDATACVIIDGEHTGAGLSSAFQCPTEVTRLVRHEGLDLNEAFRAAGLTNDSRLGSKGGAIGLLSDGSVTRAEYMGVAVRMALMQLLHPEYYT